MHYFSYLGRDSWNDGTFVSMRVMPCSSAAAANTHSPGSVLLGLDNTALYTIQRQEYKQICHRPFVGVLISVIPAINLKGLIIMKPTLRESLYLQIH